MQTQLDPVRVSEVESFPCSDPPSWNLGSATTVGARERKAKYKYDTLLLPLDGTPAAEDTLEHAIPLAHLLEAKIHLLRVCQPEPFLAAPGPMVVPALGPKSLLEEEEKRAETYLAQLRERVVRAGIDCSVRVRRGLSVRSILREVELCDADMVVAGSRGRSGLARLVLGCAAEELSRECPCPVMIVHLTDDD